MKKFVLFTMISLGFFFTLQVNAQCGKVSLIGEFNGWAGDHFLDRNAENPDMFTTVITLTDADDTSDPLDGIIEMKFRENAGWDVNWGAADFPSGTATQNGDNIPVTAGTYVVTFNCTTGEYNFQATCGNIGMIGEFNGWAEDYWMERDAANPDLWATTISLTDADDTSDPPDGKVDLKFRQNSDWGVNWGGPTFPSGTGVQDGDNIHVFPGNYYVTFNCSTGEYNFQATCGNIGLIGEFNGWSEDYWMTRDAANPDIWTATIQLTAEHDTSDPPDGKVDLKFRQNSDWGVNWGGPDFPSGTGVQDGDNIHVDLEDVPVATTYVVTFNCATGEYNFDATCGPISMIGAFNGWNGDVPMNRDAVNPDMWTLTRSWHSDSEVKFRENKDWSVNWGSDTWPTGVGTDNGPNIPLVAGTYDVSFNCNTGDYGFAANTTDCGEIGMVGDFNNWGTPEEGDVETDVYLIRDSEHPSQFSLTYNFTSSTTMFFRADAGTILNENIWGGTFPCANGVHDVTQAISVSGGKYYITFNCLSGDFCFERLGNSVSAPKVFALNVDGNLNENDWNIGQNISRIVDGTAGDDLNTVNFGVAYNDEYFFMGVDVVDGSLQANDVVEFFIDGNKSGGDYDDSDIHFTVSSAGLEVITGPDGITPEGAVAITTTGYQIEAKVAWADLGVTPVEGSQIGFDIIVGDDDDGAGVAYKMAWNGGVEDANSTSGFGDCLLGQLSCGDISIYNETIGDISLRTNSDDKTTYLATYEFFEDFNVVFRKDKQGSVAWGATDFPTGTATVGGDEIPTPTGRYRISFNCLTGLYDFTSAAPDASVAHAIYTDSPVTIDGDLSEFELGYGMTAGVVVGSGPDNNTVSWGTLWDDGNLYIGVQVVDSPVEGSGNPWDNDAIEIYIDGNHDSDGGYDGDFDTQLIMDFMNDDLLWVKADGVPINNEESIFEITDNGYNIEIRLGWDNFNFSPGKGRTIGWSIANNDSDNGVGRDYQTVWYGTGNNWSNTADLGDLQLDGGPYFVSGIEEVDLFNSSIVLFPNPTSGHVTLATIGDIFNGEVEIMISDIIGNTISIQNETFFGNQSRVNLDVNNLTAGVYFVNIKSETGKRAVKKLMIQK